MARVDVNSNDIYYIEAGDGPPPLVFLHGMSSCSEAWWQQFEAFAGRFRVIAYDSVHHGHSANSPRGQEEPARTDELEAFLAGLGIERPFFAGNSTGGATILRWAARHPDQAAGLAVSGMGIAEPGAPAFRQVEPIDDETLFLPIGDSLTGRLRAERPLMYERYLRIRSTAARLEYMRHPRPRSQETIAETERLAAAVTAVTSPMLVIVGSLDRLVPNARRLHTLVPHSQFHEVQGAPHNVYWEAAAEWKEVVGRFLDGIIA